MEKMNADGLLRNWLDNAVIAQSAHYDMARNLTRKQYIFGMFTVALTAIIGTAVFTTLNENSQGYLWVKILLGLLSVTAAVLSSLQTFLDFSGRASQHREAAVGYGKVKRKIDEDLAMANGVDDLKVNLEEIRITLDDLASSSPPTSHWAYKRGEKLVKRNVPN